MLDLLPHFPIYADLLPKSARDVIAKTHVDTLPALKLLESEGFRVTDLIDVFDAGPKVISNADSIRTVQESRCAIVGEIVREVDRILVAEGRPDDPLFLMSNGKIKEFRACIGQLDVMKDKLSVSRIFADRLNIDVGDPIWFSPLYPNSFLRRFEQWYSRVITTSGGGGSRVKGRVRGR
ncbi:hypothetical protein EBR96_07180 [bacterium]|nr:hypothetical protein [bacterium]